MGGAQGSQGSVTRGASGRAPAEVTELALGIRRASRVGTLGYAGFALIDLALYAIQYRDARLDVIALARVLGVVALAGWWSYARRDHAARRPMLVVSIAVMTVASALSGVMAAQLGGLASPYVHGLAFFFVGVAAMMPAPWWRMLAILGPIHLGFVAALMAAVALEPRLAAQWHDRIALTQGAVAIGFETVLLAFAALSAHVLWASRAQLYRARRLGRYRLEAPLGHGGMNEIWLARDDTLAREVAIKVLHGSPGPDDVRWQRFEREARVASSLTSPHTVKIYDFGASDDGVAYIAMEYLRGVDLADLVGGFGPLEVRRAVHLIRQAARSLAEAHQRGLVHRDVKPANLFVLSTPDAPDFVKVLDFGLVGELRPRGEPAGAATTLGTPAYMAPEQFLGADVSAASDVYGLGATLYFLLTGEPPHDDRDGDRAVWRQHASTRAPSVRALRADVPPALEAVLTQALAKHPADRYRDAAALLAALDDLPEVAPWTSADAAAWWSAARLAPFTTPAR